MISPLLNSQKLKMFGMGVVCSVVVICTWAIVGAEGTTITMCAKNSGDSYVIGSGFTHQSCKNNEQLLSFNVTGPQGPQGPQGVQGPVGTQGPEGGSAKVYDANNVVIGYVTDTSNNAGGMLFDLLDKRLNVLESVDMTGSIILPLHRSGASISGTTYYESSDCTGQAYIADSQGLNYDRQFMIQGDDHQYYVVDQSKLVVDLLVSGSQIQGSLGCITPDYGTYGSISIPQAVPLKNIQATIDSYVRPFHIGL